MVMFNLEKARRLKRDYLRALAAGKKEFIFKDNGDEHILLVDYARYLIEYLQTQLGEF